MNIYVETNFVLELTFEQEQHVSCEQILSLCEAGQASLVIPAYSLAEPHEKLYRQARSRREIQRLLDAELGQLVRRASYASRIQSIQNIASLMVQSNEEEKYRFDQCRRQLLRVGEIIALTPAVLTEAASCETTHGFTPQDALVYASIMHHMRHSESQNSCFLNRNFKDFDSPDIVAELDRFNCRMIPNFYDGFRFIQAQLAV